MEKRERVISCFPTVSRQKERASWAYLSRRSKGRNQQEGVVSSVGGNLSRCWRLLLLFLRQLCGAWAEGEEAPSSEEEGERKERVFSRPLACAKPSQRRKGKRRRSRGRAEREKANGRRGGGGTRSCADGRRRRRRVRCACVRRKKEEGEPKWSPPYPCRATDQP